MPILATVFCKNLARVGNSFAQQYCNDVSSCGKMLSFRKLYLLWNAC